jgi:bifunctional DNase/RNase
MNKIELEIVSLTHSVTQSHSFAVILGEKHGKRRIPIVIGNAEAQAIAIALENIVPTRPLTHDLMRDMLFSFEVNIEEIIIHNLIDGIFYSTIVCKHNNETYEFDSRTSDAVALSTRFKCPIYTYETILETAGVSIEENDIIEPEQPPISKEEAPVKRKEIDYAALSLQELEKQLQRALESEDYEKAATIRDEISKR